jgi:uncharacterized membrane protein
MSTEHRDVIVTDGGGGLGTGMIVGILVSILVLAVVIWGFGFGGFNGASGRSNTDNKAPVQIQVPLPS